MKRKVVIYNLDEDEEERSRMEFVTEKGKVKDLVVQYESLINYEWIGVVRYDCSHGF